MQTEVTLPVTATHSGVEAKGTILGLEGTTVIPVLLATVVSILLLTILVVGAESGDVFGRVVVALGPVVGTTVFVLGWVHRRPPHYARDWWWWSLSRLLAHLGLGCRGAFWPAPRVDGLWAWHERRRRR